MLSVRAEHTNSLLREGRRNIDTGQFALEDKADEIVPLIRDFLH